MKEHIHSRIAKILVVLALAVVASVMFVFVGCNNECAHENTHTETVAAATCTTEGITRTVCDDCGHVTESKTAALGHDWDEGTVVAATCTAGGYTLQTCSRCNAQRQVEPTAQLSHDYQEDTSKAVAATCTVPGSKTYVCTHCSDTYIEQTALAAHSFKPVTVAATCGTAGYTAEVCENCGLERNRVTTPATGEHTWGNDVVIPATCESAGYTQQTCSVCSATRTVNPQPALGHDFQPGTPVPATCTSEGYTIYTCANCHITETRDVTAKLDHVWKTNPENGSTVFVVEATCTMDGYSYRECENCGYPETLDREAATGHTFDWADADVVAATCTLDGSITGTCKKCDTTLTYTADEYAAAETKPVIPEEILTANGGAEKFLQATGHAYYSDMSKAFTAESIPEDKTLADMYFVCRDIGKVTIGEDELDFTGYSLVCTKCEDVRVATAAHTPDAEPAYDCVDGGADTNDGIAWTCTVCGHDEPVGEHEIEMVEIATGEVAPAGTAFTCLYQMKCSVCGYVADAQGPHKAPDPANTADAAYLATCRHGNLCVTCGEDVFGGKLDHELVKLAAGESVNNATAAEATCTAKGLEVYACRMCMEAAEDGETIAWTTLGSLPADTETEGDTTIYLTQQGNFFTAEIAMKAHVYDEEHTVKVDAAGVELAVADCTKEYWLIDYCANCDNPRIEQKGESEFAESPVTGRPWTDAQGKYGYVAGHDGHEFELVTDRDEYYNADGTLKPGMAEAGFRMPDCVTDGYMMYTCTCEGCEVESWQTISLEDYATAIGTTDDELLTMPEYHVGTMPACGHAVCNVCESSKIHTAQYTLTFVVSSDETVPEGAELPQIGMFTGWSCYLEDEDWARFEAFMSEINKNNTLYNLAYYRTYNAENDTYSNHIADLNAWKAMLVQTGEDAFRQQATIYVVCSLDEMTEGSTEYFKIDVYQPADVWGADGDLEIGWALDNTVIPYTSITKITAELSNGATVYTTAVSTGAQLEAYIAACKPYWDLTKDTLAYSVDGFTTQTGAQTCWTYTNTTSITKGTSITGFTLTVTIECGEDLTFVGTATML